MKEQQIMRIFRRKKEEKEEVNNLPEDFKLIIEKIIGQIDNEKEDSFVVISNEDFDVLYDALVSENKLEAMESNICSDYLYTDDLYLIVGSSHRGHFIDIHRLTYKDFIKGYLRILPQTERDRIEKEKKEEQELKEHIIKKLGVDIDVLMRLLKKYVNE